MFSPTNTNFIFTSETTPAVSTNLKQSIDMVLPLVGIADAVNVTDSPNSKTRLSSLLVAAGIKELGLDVILQLTGRDRNRIAIESEVLGALSLGINKVLCLTGDKPSKGGPQVVNELDSAGIMKLLAGMSNGKLSDGTDIKEPLPIFPGAADDLYFQKNNSEAIGFLKIKIGNGARFVQTQYCFDEEICTFYSDLLMANGKTDDLKVLIGLGPLKSAKQALWMRENLWGVNISDNIISRLDASNNPNKEGLIICHELISKFMDLPGIDGVHLMGPNCEHDSAEIIKLFR
jgi:methylenetetrahydrofolate reductase (NADPH)